MLGHEHMIQWPAQQGILGVEGAIPAAAPSQIEHAADLAEQFGRG